MRKYRRFMGNRRQYRAVYNIKLSLDNIQKYAFDFDY